ncbi:Protein SPT2 [Dermatophagoides farinae]|uniref:Protein SPT2 n=1 Tax=Dermatophagoides farinae TaxID=6954 RepID=A0A922HTP0_DERFA|nr:Protein SPT2 [Dermatophagoides farinae]
MDYQDLLEAAQRNTEQQSSLLRRRQMNGLNRGPDPMAIANLRHEEKQRLLSLRAQNSKSMRKAQMMKSRTKDNNFGRIVTTDDDRLIEEKIRQKSIDDTKKTRKDRDKVMKRLEQEEPVKVQPKTMKISDIIRQSSKQKTNGPNVTNNQTKLKTSKQQPPPLSYDQLLNMAAEKSTQKISLEDEIKSELEFQEKNSEKKRQALCAKEKQRQIDYYRNDAAERRPMAKTKTTTTTQEVKTQNSNCKQSTNDKYHHVVNRTPASKQMKTTIDQRSKKTDQENPKKLLDHNRNSNHHHHHQQQQQFRQQQQQQPQSKLSQNSTKHSSSVGAMTNMNGNRLQSIRSENDGKKRMASSSSSLTASSSMKNRDNQSKPSKPRLQQQQQRQQQQQPIRTLSPANMFDTKSSMSSKQTTSLSKSLPQKSVISKTTSLSSSSMMDNRNRLQQYQPQQRQPIHQQQRMPPPQQPRPKLPPIGATYRRGIYYDYQQDDQYKNDVDDDYYNNDDYEDDEMDEEDDEMADFIDDGPIEEPEPEEEYSRHIREIFGYDKRKYRNIIEDDIEEASYGQCMKEEMRSLREGIREDLEDIRREEQEKRLKALQKKARMKGLKGY